MPIYKGVYVMYNIENVTISYTELIIVNRIFKNIQNSYLKCFE